jgi:hypothetical protein
MISIYKKKYLKRDLGYIVISTTLEELHQMFIDFYALFDED